MAVARRRRPVEEHALSGKVVERVEVDWPKSLGFFGAIGAATALELIPIPIALFVASVPFLKLLNRPDAPKAGKFFSELVDGASKPVGGDSEGTVRWRRRSETKAGGHSPRESSRSPNRTGARRK
jgi:hypothetical protein